MDIEVARSIATDAYVSKRDRFGDLLVEHAGRVAAAVAPDAKATAWLHDVPEVGGPSASELRHAGLSVTELDALELLTKASSEVFELYVLRIAHAPGEAGRLARTVMLADLDDHLAHATAPDRAPPYAWGRRHIAIAQWRRHENDAPAQIAV